jgi:hypothetical protein
MKIYQINRIKILQIIHNNLNKLKIRKIFLKKGIIFKSNFKI